MVCQHDERDFRRSRMQGAQDIDGGSANQLEIKDNAVRLRFSNSGDRFGWGFRFADHRDAVNGSHQLDQPTTNRRGILDDEYLASATRFHGTHYRQMSRTAPSAAADYGHRRTTEARGRWPPGVG